MQDYRELIRAEIERQGLNHNQLQKLTGVHRIVIGRWLRGERDAVESTTLAKLAAALGLELRRTGKVGRE